MIDDLISILFIGKTVTVTSIDKNVLIEKSQELMNFIIDPSECKLVIIHYSLYT